MTQTLAILTRHGSLQREIPNPDQQVVTGVRWGCADEFPSPAYWLQQALARRLEQPAEPQGSGRTLAEEVGAWLLGGQGVTAAVAQAAYERLRERGAFAREGLTQADYAAWLAEPLDVAGRLLPYRQAEQKAKYLAATMPTLIEDDCALQGHALRNWLMTLSGLGPKTATGIVRGWCGAVDDVALVDSQLVRVGQVIGLFPAPLTVERHYLELEARFLRLCAAMELRALELETVIHQEIGRSPETLRFLTDHLKAATAAIRPRRVPMPEQLSLVFTA